MCLDIIEFVKHKKNLSSLEFAIVIITGLVQRGGFNSNGKSSLVYEVDNNHFSANEFHSTTYKKCNCTIRQFCK